MSCATGPKYSDRDVDSDEPLLNEFAELAAGGNAYLYLDVPAMRPVIEHIELKNISGANSDTEKILDKTESGVIGVYPEESERSFMVSANGKFPVWGSSVAMTFSPVWKKVTSETGIKYWRSEKQNLSLALSSQKAFLSDGLPFQKISEWTTAVVEVPENFSEIRRSAVMAGWINQAGEKINPFLADIGIPIQIPADRMLFAFYTVVPSPIPLYDGTLYFEFPTVSQARAVTTILSFTRLIILDAVDVSNTDDSQTLGKILKSLLSNSPVLDEASIKLKTGNMNADEISFLFNMFSAQ
jgi:hypothetical protein